jgi:hypothetical protein
MVLLLIICSRGTYDKRIGRISVIVKSFVYKLNKHHLITEGFLNKVKHIARILYVIIAKSDANALILSVRFEFIEK